VDIVKPVILTFVGCYLPGYRGGGPIRTIANMVDRLGDEFEFRIITMDRDLGDVKPYENVKVDSWNAVGKEQGTQDEYDEVTFMKTPYSCASCIGLLLVTFWEKRRRWVGTPAQKN